MIKMNKGKVEIIGKKVDVLVDFIAIAHSLLSTKAFSVEGLQKAVEAAAKAEDIDEGLFDVIMEIMTSKGKQHEEKSWEEADD